MESWRFASGGNDYVLRRAPTLEFMEGRPFGHDTEAAIIRAAYKAGVTAPEVVAQLIPQDGIGSGFVMRALPGTPDPKAILAMETPDKLLCDLARDLAKIHDLPRDQLPAEVPQMDYRAAIADFHEQFEEAGGDRPIIALGIKWLEDNCPDPCEPVLNHGDYRLGNFLAEDGRLTGVLDWELAHYGDPHEDVAFGCMAVWRFARYDRPALGLGSLDAYFSAYEEAGGGKIDPARFRYWLIHRTVWWALGCVRMAAFWRSGQDRMLERVVISRRTSEQELDLLMLLEEDAPEEERSRKIHSPLVLERQPGEASSEELATAISEWITSLKSKLEGHDLFQLAVARNALGIIGRDSRNVVDIRSSQLCKEIAKGAQSLSTPWLLQKLKQNACDKLHVDVPKYPALEVARKKWTGEG